jgi:hypothetical protein
MLGQALPEEGPGHVIKASIHEFKAYDPAVISRLLDDEPLPTRHDDVPLGPFLTLEHRCTGRRVISCGGHEVPTPSCRPQSRLPDVAISKDTREEPKQWGTPTYLVRSS